MARNGSGNYSPPASSFPVVSGTLIESAKFNTTINDIASALTQSISNDGQTPILANIPMGGFKLTGLAAGVASGQSVEFGQLSAYAPLASPVLTGNPTAPTPPAGDNDTSIATTAFVAASFAPLASPALTGNPTAPTPASGDNDTSIATTAFVAAGFAPIASAVPVGTVISVAQATAPTGYLKANGAAVSRTTYAALFAAIVTAGGFASTNFTVTIATPGVFTKTTHGFSGGERLRLSTTGTLPTGLNNTTDYYVEIIDANTFYLSTTSGGTRINTSGTQSGTHSYLRSWYGLGDGSTTFNVPDLRGEFVRGWDDGRAIDSGRTLGSFQADEFKSHNHAPPTGTFLNNNGNGTGLQGGAGTPVDYNVTTTGSTGGTETRPRNVALLACIKY